MSNFREWISPDGRIRLINADCLEVLPTLEAGSVDAVVTDPPYGTTNSPWDSIIPLQPMWERLHAITLEDSPIVLFCAEPFASELRASNRKEWRYDWIWEKSRPTRFLDAKRMPLVAHEIVSVFGRTRPRYYPQMVIGAPSHGGGKNSKPSGIYHKHEKKPTESNGGLQYPRTVLKFPSVAPGSPHPNQKPLPLVEYVVETYSAVDDMVLDFTAGSFTTAIACIRTNRRCIAIEKEAKYFDIGVDRCKAELAKTSLFDRTEAIA